MDYRTSQVEAGLQDMRTQIGQLGELHEKLAELVGSAESADGRIRAECTVAAVPAKLEIDPRAMRIGSQELAATISEVIREASADLRHKMHETMNQGFGGKGLRDSLDEARSRANEAMAAFRRAASEGVAEVEGLRRRLDGQSGR
jgi:DNA-binding protein YbaB